MKKTKLNEPRRAPTSTKPAAVFSYYSNRSGADVSRGRYEPQATDMKGFERLKHIPTVIALVIIVACVGYASLLTSSPRVMIAATETGKSLQRADSIYANFIANEFDNSVFNKSKLTFNSQPMTESLRKQFPEVDNVVVTLPLIGHKPVVRIAVSSPAFILATQTGAYYISSSGVPLVRVSEVQNPISGLSTVSDESGLPIQAGKQVLPADTVDFISQVIQQLNATKTDLDALMLPIAANELQFRIKGKPYVVRLNTLLDARTQIGTYRAVEQRLEGSRDAPKEYIDVRVEERAYYK